MADFGMFCPTHPTHAGRAIGIVLRRFIAYQWECFVPAARRENRAGVNCCGRKINEGVIAARAGESSGRAGGVQPAAPAPCETGYRHWRAGPMR